VVALIDTVSCQHENFLKTMSCGSNSTPGSDSESMVTKSCQQVVTIMPTAEHIEKHSTMGMVTVTIATPGSTHHMGGNI